MGEFAYTAKSPDDDSVPLPEGWPSTWPLEEGPPFPPGWPVEIDNDPLAYQLGVDVPAQLLVTAESHTVAVRLQDGDGADNGDLAGYLVKVTATKAGDPLLLKKLGDASLDEQVYYPIADLGGGAFGFNAALIFDIDSGDSGDTVAVTATVVNVTADPAIAGQDSGVVAIPQMELVSSIDLDDVLRIARVATAQGILYAQEGDNATEGLRVIDMDSGELLYSEASPSLTNISGIMMGNGCFFTCRNDQTNVLDVVAEKRSLATYEVVGSVELVGLEDFQNSYVQGLFCNESHLFLQDLSPNDGFLFRVRQSDLVFDTLDYNPYGYYYVPYFGSTYFYSTAGIFAKRLISDGTATVSIDLPAEDFSPYKHLGEYNGKPVHWGGHGSADSIFTIAADWSGVDAYYDNDFPSSYILAAELYNDKVYILIRWYDEFDLERYTLRVVDLATMEIIDSLDVKAVVINNDQWLHFDNGFCYVILSGDVDNEVKPSITKVTAY